MVFVCVTRPFPFSVWFYTGHSGHHVYIGWSDYREQWLLGRESFTFLRNTIEWMSVAWKKKRAEKFNYTLGFSEGTRRTLRCVRRKDAGVCHIKRKKNIRPWSIRGSLTFSKSIWCCFEHFAAAMYILGAVEIFLMYMTEGAASLFGPVEKEEDKPNLLNNMR